MPTKITLPDGRVIEATPVDIEESIERWSEVKLGDGTVVKLKLALISADRTDQYDLMGNPIYNFNFAPVIALGSVPDNLKRRTN
jgi:hypothetical protein